MKTSVEDLARDLFVAIHACGEHSGITSREVARRAFERAEAFEAEARERAPKKPVKTTARAAKNGNATV